MSKRKKTKTTGGGEDRENEEQFPTTPVGVLNFDNTNMDFTSGSEKSHGGFALGSGSPKRRQKRGTGGARRARSGSNASSGGEEKTGTAGRRIVTAKAAKKNTKEEPPATEEEENGVERHEPCCEMKPNPEFGCCTCTDFSCQYGCGFRGCDDGVQRHEPTCDNNPVLQAAKKRVESMFAGIHIGDDDDDDGDDDDDDDDDLPLDIGTLSIKGLRRVITEGGHTDDGCITVADLRDRAREARSHPRPKRASSRPPASASASASASAAAVAATSSNRLPFVKLHPQDSGAGLPSVFLTDPREFTPVPNPLHDAVVDWGLSSDGNRTMESMMRKMQTQLWYLGPDLKTPEEQFVDVLVERKRERLLRAAREANAEDEEEVSSKDLVVRVSLVNNDDLRDLQPPVWRRVRLSAGLNLSVLHDRVLGPLMGWQRNYHGYYFTDLRDGAVWCPLNESRAIDMMHASSVVISALEPRETTLGELLRSPGDRVGYCYDLGDCWYHTLSLEEVVTASDGANGRVVVQGGEMRCPNENGGGGPRYQTEVLDLLKSCDADDIGKMSIKQLKSFVRDRGGSLRGCSEKADLLALAQSLRNASSASSGKLASACADRVSALNVGDQFLPTEFSVEATQERINQAISSRASASGGEKQFVQSFGPGSFMNDSAQLFGTQPGHQRVSTSVEGSSTSMQETISTRPDKHVDAVCAVCGSPNNLKRCGGCKSVWFCCGEHQAEDWERRHKKECKKLRKERKKIQKEEKARKAAEEDKKAAASAAPSTSASASASASAPAPAPAPSPDDERGLVQEDIKLVMSQAACERASAVRALRESDGDIVDAIRALIM